MWTPSCILFCHFLYIAWLTTQQIVAPSCPHANRSVRTPKRVPFAHSWPKQKWMDLELAGKTIREKACTQICVGQTLPGVWRACVPQGIGFPEPLRSIFPMDFARFEFCFVYDQRNCETSSLDFASPTRCFVETWREEAWDGDKLETEQRVVH